MKKLDKQLQKLDIYECDDLESQGLYDEVRAKITQALRATGIDKGYLDPTTFTKRDLGIKATAEIYQASDGAIGSEEIQREIDRVGKRANKFSRKESKAIEFIKACMSAGFYGYLRLRKWLGIPLESFTIRTSYAGYLPVIPLLVNPGGEIKLRDGIYNILTSINLSVPTGAIIKFIGTGDATVLKAGAGGSFSKGIIGGNAVTAGSVIQDIKIDANNYSIPGIQLDNCLDMRISNVNIQGAKNVGGIYVDGTTQTTIEDCYIHDCVMGIYSLGNVGFTVVGGVFRNNDQDGIYITTNDDWTSSDIHILGTVCVHNSVIGAGYGGIAITRGGVSGLTKVRQVKIIGCSLGNETSTDYGAITQSYGYREVPSPSSGLVPEDIILIGNDLSGNVVAPTNTLESNRRYMVNNTGYNPVGNFTAPAVPASGTELQNTYGYPCLVTVYGGTVTDIAVGHSGSPVSTGLTTGTFVLAPGEVIVLTYSAAPSWKWYGL